jgi:hypothetical protein
MKNFSVKSLIISVFLSIVAVCSAQNGLTEKDKKRVEKADVILKKAAAVVDKNSKYTSQIETLKNDGKVRTRKIQRLERKANEIVMKSSSYFKEGYSKKYNAYEKAISRELKAGNLTIEVERDKDKGHEAFKTGMKWRRKSGRQSDVNKGVEYLYKANELHEDAIGILIQALGNYQSDPVNKEPIETQSTEVPEMKSDSIDMPSEALPVLNPPVAPVPIPVVPALNDSAIVIPDTVTPVAQPVLEESFTIENTLEEEAATELVEELFIYFSVQFLAEKQPVPKEKLYGMYDGPFEVVLHEADGWFRYSFGRFKTQQEANDMLAKSGVSGYVVAYHNEERISTRRAAELLTAEPFR